MTPLAKLPELPEPEGSMKWTRSAGVCINPEPGYTADQMREYALAALSPASPATDHCTCPSETRCAGTCPYYQRLHTTPPAHGDGEGDWFGDVLASTGEVVPFDVVREVVKARTRLGFASPEGQEEQAARVVELIRELCEEVINLTTRPTPEAQEARDEHG